MPLYEGGGGGGGGGGVNSGTQDHRSVLFLNPSIRPCFRSNPNPHYLKPLSGIVSLQRTVVVFYAIF